MQVISCLFRSGRIPRREDIVDVSVEILTSKMCSLSAYATYPSFSLFTRTTYNASITRGMHNPDFSVHVHNATRRNRESECTRARERWSCRTNAPAMCRERVCGASSAQRILLPATSAICFTFVRTSLSNSALQHLGEGLQIHDARTDLKQVLVTLQQDLRGWSGNLHLATIHDQLALKLIDTEQRKRRSQKLQRELSNQDPACNIHVRCREQRRGCSHFTVWSVLKAC